MRDPYEVLGIPRGASGDTIKKAYRERARDLHPDSQPGNVRAEEMFKELAAAYDILSNRQKRAHFDREKASAGDGRPRNEARHYPENPFASFLRHRQSRRRGGIKVRGADVTYTLTIGFLDSARGTTRRVDMTSGKRLEVRVPAGTHDGQVLRLQGQGMTGMGGATTATPWSRSRSKRTVNSASTATISMSRHSSPCPKRSLVRRSTARSR